ncbi:MAG: hypothetical protein R3E70_15100 [Burkholderiaceae bacterium]
MQALAARQSHSASTCPDLLTLDATATAPFSTGLGNEHLAGKRLCLPQPLRPALPARQRHQGRVARPRANCQRRVGRHARLDERHRSRSGAQGRGKNIELSVLDVLFGRESDDGDIDHVRGALCFWDAIPQIKGDALAVDIMTPHQSHYYQQRQHRKSGDSTSPHDSGQPNPISFLTLPPGTGFALHVQCDAVHLHRLAPDLRTISAGKPC